MKTSHLIALPVLLLGSVGFAQEDSQASDPQGEYVTREEYDALARLLEQLRADVAALQPQRDTDGMLESLAGLQQNLLELQSSVDANRPGESSFLMTGFGSVGFSNAEGEDSSFGASINPLFLWKVDERLFVQAELEIELEEEESEFELEMFDVSYILNDAAMISAGKIFSPLSNFRKNLHPTWINKLPNAPLYAGHHGALVPLTELGVQLHGATRINDGPAKIDYALWVGNGPTLVMEGHEAGTLEFENNEDSNNSKGVGARVGLTPTENLNFGLASWWGEVGPSGSDAGDVDARISTVDLNYVRQFDCINGTIDFRVEHVWSSVDDPAVAFLDDEGDPLGPFDNDRRGGYVQLAYRPTEVENEFWRDVEFVGRFDFLNVPEAGGGSDAKRNTFGINYWLGPSSVLKLAFQTDRISGGEKESAVLLQWATGL